MDSPHNCPRKSSRSRLRSEIGGTMRNVFFCCNIDTQLTRCQKAFCSDSEEELDTRFDKEEAVPRSGLSHRFHRFPNHADKGRDSDAADLLEGRIASIASDLKVGLAFTGFEPDRLVKGMVALSPTENTLVFIFSRPIHDDTIRKDFTMSFKTVESVLTFYQKDPNDWPLHVATLSVDKRDCFLCIIDRAPPIYFALESKRFRDNLLYFLKSRTECDIPDPS